MMSIGIYGTDAEAEQAERLLDDGNIDELHRLATQVTGREC